LGIAIGSDPELEPRIELTASAYSLNERSVADSAVTSAKIADGQVVRSLNGVIWMKCNIASPFFVVTIQLLPVGCWP